MINRKFFFDYVKLHLFAGTLAQSQVAGMTAILDEWEKKHANEDDRWVSYMLGTTHHETDKRMQPIREYGRGRGMAYGTTYYGRGFVQLTWEQNYQKMSEVTGVNLVKNPDRALELPIATQIMFYGMINGSFTGKKLTDYFNKTTDNWVQARQIINRLDKAQLIAGYAKDYYAAISYTT